MFFNISFARSWHHVSRSWGGLLGWWSNNSTNSHPSLAYTCLIDALVNCDWMPASYTSGQPSNLLSFVTLEPHSPARLAMESGHLHPSSANTRHLKSRHPFVPTTQHFHQFIWQQQHTCGTLGRLSMECGVDSQFHKTLHFHHQYPPPLEWPSQEEPGSCLTASALVLDISTPACTNRVWPLLWPVSVAQNNKLLTMLSSNVQSINLPMDCIAWPDGSGRWDNWMAARHLPWDLVQPSSGFKNSLKRRIYHWKDAFKMSPNQIAVILPLGAANCISLLWGTASIKWLGTTDLAVWA